MRAVCFASYHCCIRVVKQTLALTQRGVYVVNLCHHIANSDLEHLLPHLSFFEDQYEYREKLESMRFLDLIHVHNEPDWLGRIARNARPDLPIVFDAHDLNSIRLGWVEDDEKFVFAHSDGFIFPSEAYKNVACDLHGIDPDLCEVVFSANLENHFVKAPKPRLNAIVYEGGLTAGEPSTSSIDFMARDMTELCRALSRYEIPVVLYGANGDYIPHYTHTGAICMPPTVYEYMLGELSRYSWGLVGNITSCNQRKYAMPNKLFEYIASGIPVLVLNAEEAGLFVERNQIGIFVQGVEDIVRRFHEHETFRKNVLETRFNWTMERQVDKVLKLYQKAREHHEREIRAGCSVLFSSRGLGNGRSEVCTRSEGCGCAFCKDLSSPPRNAVS